MKLFGIRSQRLGLYHDGDRVSEMRETGSHRAPDAAYTENRMS
jgi:hypothetical protein